MAAQKQVNELVKRLKNVGPKLAEKLLEVGIDSPEILKAVGALKAFNLMYQSGDKYGDFNAAYLYALEGAIRDCDWLDIPESIKAEYQAYAQQLQKQRKQRS